MNLKYFFKSFLEQSQFLSFLKIYADFSVSPRGKDRFYEKGPTLDRLLSSLIRSDHGHVICILNV